MASALPWAARLKDLGSRALGSGQARATRATVLLLALPAIGEQVLTMMVGLVDTYLVGRLGAAPLAGVGLANQVLMLTLTLIFAVATGATALVARQVGGGEATAARRTTQQAVLMGAILGTLIAGGTWLWADALVRLFGPAPEVAATAAMYLRIASAPFTLQAVLLLGNAALRGAGDTRTPLYLMVGVNLVNILCSALLIYGLGPFPALGVQGSAIGAALARSLGGVMVLWLLARGRSGLRLSWRGWRLHGQTIRRVLNVGLPAGGEQLLMRLGQAAFTRVVTALGTTAFAAHQVAITGQSLSFMPGFGFAVAATTLVGQALGAKDVALARRYSRQCLGMAAVLMGMMGLVLVILAPQIMLLFVPDTDVVAVGVGPNRLLGLLQPMLAAMMVYSGALRGAGDTRWTLVATALSIWLVRLPLAHLFSTGLGWGLLGAWAAMGIDMSLRALAYRWRFRSGAWARLRV